MSECIRKLNLAATSVRGSSSTEPPKGHFGLSEHDAIGSHPQWHSGRDPRAAAMVVNLPDPQHFWNSGQQGLSHPTAWTTSTQLGFASVTPFPGPLKSFPRRVRGHLGTLNLGLGLSFIWREWRRGGMVSLMLFYHH